MNPRHQSILNALIEIHVNDGGAVSSRRVARLPWVNLSPASVRKAFAELESEGFLTKTHTSSGRLPTQRAYRFYVNQIADRLRPDDRFRDLFRFRMRRDSHDVEALLRAVSSFLSDLTDHLGIIARIRSMPLELVGLRLVALEGERLLVVTTFAPRREHVAILELSRGYPPHVLARAESYLNERLAGRSVHEAGLILERALDDLPGEEGRVAREVGTHRDAILDAEGPVEYALEGAEKVLELPELADPASLRSFVSMLGQKDRLADRLRRLTEQDPGLHVQIGAESPWYELRPFSLVTATRDIGDCREMVGVLGPTSMDYESIIRLVHMVTEEIQTLDA